MPTLPIPTTSNGSHTDWTVVGTTEGWEAVLKGSPDTSYILSSVTGNEATFNCGPGWATTPGRIMALTVHYRLRQTSLVGATVELYITQGGTDRSAGTLVILPATAGWVSGSSRIRQDWTTLQRFSLTDVADLGVGVHMVTGPSAGRIEVSQLWIEVEYVDTFQLYDPFDGALPDAITGPLDWQATVGSQPASITGDKYLQINDTSTTDLKAYLHVDFDGMTQFTSSYVVEMETRVSITDTSVSLDVVMSILLGIDDDLLSFGLFAAKFGGVYHLCFSDILGAPPVLPTDCLALAPFDFNNKDTHLRVKMDRDTSSGTPGRAQLFVNYNSVPILDIFTTNFPASTLSNPRVGFGTTLLGECLVKLDYYAWKAYKKRGSVFSGWSSYDFGTNEINEDNSDTDIVRLQLIDPPGITVGQSDYACRLDVNDSSELCRLYQVTTLQAATNYKIDIDYKMDIGVVVGELVLQRLPDLYFWDETGGVWSSTPASVDLANSTTRLRAPIMTGINLATLGQVIVSIQAKITPSAVHKIWVYKVYLVEE